MTDLANLTEISIFLPAFLAGLGYAILLPLLGCYLRLRNETLAALAYAQVGATGALSAMALALPLPLGGLGFALLIASIKPSADKTGETRNSFYALTLVLAWAIGILLTSHFPLAERLGHALFDGQLLLSGQTFPWLILAATLLATGLLRRWGHHLLLSRIFPDTWALQAQRPENRMARWIDRGFDLLAATVIALATMTLGVMATFALLLIPAWRVFTQAPNWQKASLSAILNTGFAYVLAFAVALLLDLTFGPVLVLSLALAGRLKMRGTPGSGFVDQR